MLFPERRFGLVNNSNNLFDYLFSDPIFNVNVANRISTDIKVKENGYELDITDERYHHEIYLSDPRKCDVNKLKTVIRHPIKKIK